MAIKAVTFDAYGTLLRNEDLMMIPRAIMADHRLSISAEEIWQRWMALYFEATQSPPFRTMRAIQGDVLKRLLRECELDADADPYVDLFFRVTTSVELYSDALGVLKALGDIPTAVISNADNEHVNAWKFELPVDFVLISERVRAYKPHPRVFESALRQLGGIEPHQVLHVGDSEVDDVTGAKAAGLRVVWVNRDGRQRRADVPEPDFEVRDLAELPILIRRLR